MIRYDAVPGEHQVAACGALLRSLPDWFGMESSIVDYLADIACSPTWSCWGGDALQGFLTTKTHFEDSVEVHVMAVALDSHRMGIGRRLLGACEEALREQNVRFLQVKTLSATKEDPYYARTREFYMAMGFTPLEEFPTLWDEWNPCLQLMKALLPPRR